MLKHELAVNIITEETFIFYSTILFQNVSHSITLNCYISATFYDRGEIKYALESLCQGLKLKEQANLL